MSTQNQTKAHEEFTHAIKLRKTYPLRSGAYKLKEKRDLIQCIAKEILAYSLRRRDTSRSRQPWENLGQAERLESIVSKIIPYHLGYDLLPAINALGSDKVSIRKINLSLPYFRQEINSLLDECEHVHKRLSHGVGYECELWDNDDSSLIPLLDKAVSLFEEALDMVPPPTK